MTEVRWHARAGQGAKTAAHLLAEASLRAGKSVQAFPEYGPERRGAPVRAFTRVSDGPIRRHDPISEPDLVVVLEPSLARDRTLTDDLGPGGLVLVNAEEQPSELAGERVLCVPADRLAAEAGVRFANIVMLGAAAAVLGEPALDQIEEAAVAGLSRKVGADAVRAAVREGFAWAS
jgi:2-oxoacid:acceptor oxidoreductase gamma subunit (pyruvate/2-ketoisovalerate family)